MFEDIELYKSNKGTATGTMNGKVVSLSDDQTYPFKATWIYRDNQNGTLSLRGTVDDLESPGRTSLIGLALTPESAPSGTYSIGVNPVTLTLLYMTFIRDTGVTTDYEGIEGWVELKSAYPEKPISGKLWFKTRPRVGRAYEVELDFNIPDF
ncbi:hypothetical protein [Pseudomonas sp. RIT357]|uniref:hypothetical protein n=1 Tax=Pseudomonas sp. RIT357 TaxID=1470593 RepID=UPI000448765E|nr:hypothetical protein [Pseudomonas sp. RIT357]EZP65943.1 hypothetical protein BW43_02963 [Pseudomonas sp. RIT357]